MHNSFNSFATVTHLLHKKPTSDPIGAHTTTLDQQTLDIKAGIDHGKGINRKCHCSKPTESKLTGWELFSFAHKDRQSMKSSAARTIHEVETDMATPSNISGRPNILMKWVETRGYEQPPDEHECKECLEGNVEIEEREKLMYFQEEPANDEEIRDGIYAPKPVIRQSLRRNPFKEIQLCPHLLHKIFDVPKEQFKIKRDDCLIDFLKTHAELNHRPEEPRAGTKSVDSWFFEISLKNINQPKITPAEGKEEFLDLLKENDSSLNNSVNSFDLETT